MATAASRREKQGDDREPAGTGPDRPVRPRPTGPGLLGLAAQERTLGVLVTALVLFLVAVPLGTLLVSSVRSTGDRLPFQAAPFTLANFARIFSGTTTMPLVETTVVYAIGSALLALVLAVTFAWLLERSDLPARRTMLTFMLAPMAVPAVVLAMAWSLLANPVNGLFDVILREALHLSGEGPINIYSVPGMVFVTGLRFCPLVYLMIGGAFARMDPRFEEASATTGASRWATFWRISLPLLRPAIMGAVAYFLVMGLDIFDIPAIMGMPRGIYVVSTRIFVALHPPGGLPDYGLASAWGALSVLPAGLLIWYYARLTRHNEQFAVLSGRDYRPTHTPLGRWRYVAVGGISAYFLATTVLPVAILAWSSLLPYYQPPALALLHKLSWTNYTAILQSGDVRSIVENTVVIGAVVAVAVMALSTIVARLDVRRLFRGSGLGDRLTFVSLATPSTVFAAGLMFFYLSIPGPIYGSIWIIVIGLTTRYLAFGTRLMHAAHIQVDRELEEASQVSGSRWWRTLTSVVLPLLRPSIIRGMFWGFVTSSTDVTLPLILAGVGNTTLAVYMYLQWGELGNLSGAAAVAVPLVLVSSLLAMSIARATLREQEGRL